MSDIEQRGGELERFIPQGQLADRQAQELALVGFSPEFPLRVAELNDALVQFIEGSFTGYRFILHPDEEHPKIDVEARHTFPYNVVIDAGINQRASLAITPRQKGPDFIGRLRLSQLHQFIDNYPTDEDMVMTAEPRDLVLKGVERPVRVSGLFSEFTTVADFESFGIKPAKFNLEVGFDSCGSKLSMPFGYVYEPRIDEPTISLQEVVIVDEPQKLEAVMGSLAILLSKDAFANENED